jgi:kinetochore protein Mis13/DSN1
MKNTRLPLLAYDEEDDGFMFSRVKKPKSKSTAPPHPPPQPSATKKPLPERVQYPRPAPSDQDVPATAQIVAKPVKKKPPKMSFSTPKAVEERPVRRSKRISDEHDPQAASPRPRSKRGEPPVDASKVKVSPAKNIVPSEQQPVALLPAEVEQEQHSHSGTKIALPFADTPVIRRNKAMRENKGGKGERRSSLSLRGRRASSLIDTGNSNALPHNEVEIPDFYKHIESDGLPEPRRMKQLLTWCATRCFDQRERGGTFEDASAVAAARVIEEELLKDLANRSDLSDWFSREDVVPPPKELPERLNPKNLQNAEKIRELSEQIKR